MAEQRFEIDVPGKGGVTAIRTEPEGPSTGWTFIYAPGAGSNVHDPFGVYLCRRLASRGVLAVRMQFPYMEARKRRPDPTATLEATWRAAIDSLRGGTERLAAGGRSMGGRIASQVVAQGDGVDALALFAYPLHPPGRPEQLRDGHLAEIETRTLFCSGTRDAFAAPAELRAVADKVKDTTVHLLEAADHGFSAPKASGRTRDELWREAADAMVAWLGI